MIDLSAPLDGTPDSPVRIVVDGMDVMCQQGQTVAGALLMQGIFFFRSSPTGQTPRGPFCMMGACQECAIWIDGSVRRACQTEVRDGMALELRGAGSQ